MQFMILVCDGLRQNKESVNSVHYLLALNHHQKESSGIIDTWLQL